MVHEITVHIRGGAVQDITNISSETAVKVIDWDIDGIERDLLTEVDGELALVQLWHVKDVPTPHGPNCECGACTGEDKALARMELGISECENMFEPDSDNHDAGEHHVF